MRVLENNCHRANFQRVSLLKEKKIKRRKLVAAYTYNNIRYINTRLNNNRIAYLKHNKAFFKLDLRVHSRESRFTSHEEIVVQYNCSSRHR